MERLRDLAWRSSFTLAARQMVGMAVSFGGLVTLARLIGPAPYGIFVSAFALHMWLALLLQWGVDVFLIRRAHEPDRDEIDQALTIAVGLGCLGAALGWPAGRLAEAWIGTAGVAETVTLLFLGMPLHLATLVPSALLQRRLAYRRVAAAELAGQLALYGGAVTAAVAGLRLGAPLAGWWMQQVVMAALFFRLAGYRPRLVWRPNLVCAIAGFGAGYAASMWTWRLRELVNPLIIARELGPEAAAGVAVAIRMVESLSFMKTVLWRVSLPALGRMQSDRTRLAAAVAEGARLQVLAVGVPLAVFAAAAPWLVPLVFGTEWGAVTAVYPYLAAAWLVNATFSLHSSALTVLGRIGDLAAFHLTHVTVLAAAAAAMVPDWGTVGYGIAEMVALATYALPHLRARAVLGPLPVGLPLGWSACLALPMFADRLGPAAWVGPMAALALPVTWRTLAGWWTQIKELAHG